jgi:alpha-L-fucosidase
MHRLSPLLATVAVLLAAVTSTPVTAVEEDGRLDWFREARFGMFIHWGLYAIPAGTWEESSGHGEWIMHTAQIPLEDYETLVSRFNPVRFDAEEWAGFARDAGMRYVVLTSKHHDGFCLWDSALTDYDIMATPFGRDVVRELGDACRRAGIRFCVYHSIMDWHHPDYLPRRGWETRSAEGADYDRYVHHLKGQLRELVEDRGPMGILWFDGEWEDTWTHDRGVDLYDYVRSLQPDIIINNRVDKGRAGMAGLTRSAEFAGDYGTPEQEVPSRGIPGVDWESCITMNNTWGYSAGDRNWKSTAQLVQTLVETASKGGNLLLNVGPKPDGRFPQASVDRLRAMGQWLAVNGESIYGTRATPFDRLAWPCTRREGRLYVHVFEWPDDLLLRLPGLRNPVHRVRFLDPAGGAGDLAWERTGDVVQVELPSYAPNALDSVVVLEVDGMPVADPVPITVRADGVLCLQARDARVHGGRLGYEAAKDCLGFWTDPADWASWDVGGVPPAQYRVELDLACEDETAGSRLRVVVGEEAFMLRGPATGAWDRFQTVSIGPVQLLEDAPLHRVEVRAEEKPNYAVANLRELRLVPIAGRAPAP